MGKYGICEVVGLQFANETYVGRILDPMEADKNLSQYPIQYMECIIRITMTIFRINE